MKPIFKNPFFFITLCFFLLSLTACSKSKDVSLENPDNAFSISRTEDISSTDTYDKNGHTNDEYANDEYANDEYINDEYASDDYFDDDYFDDDSQEASARKDPLIWWNKPVFLFNDFVLLKIGKPINKFYTTVVARKFRSGIKNFTNNIRAPLRMGNALLQAEFSQFFSELGKFMINTMTSVGLADVAATSKPRTPYNPDNLRFGYTLAKWNVPQGPYLVLPLLGPSTVREGIGSIGTALANPISYFAPWEAAFAVTSVTTVHDLNNAIIAYEMLKENSFDPYISLRNAYLERLNFIEPK